MAYLFKSRGIWFVGYTTPSGKRVKRSTRIHVDQPKAEKRARQVLAYVESKMAQDPFALTLRDDAKKGLKLTSDDLLEEFLKNGTMRAPNSIQAYRLAMRKLKPFVRDFPIARVDTKNVVDMRDALLKPEEGEPESEGSVSNYIRHLTAVFAYAVRKRWIQDNPIAPARFEPKKNPITVFTDDELEKVFEAADPELVLLLRFLLLTGFRVGDACNFRWKAVHFDEEVIHYDNQKGKRVEPYPMTDELMAFMRTIPRRIDSEYVFTFRNPISVNHALKRVTRRLGMREELNVHALKKTYVSRLVQNPNLSVTDVHYLAHHVDIQTTMKYYTQFNIDGMRERMQAPLPARRKMSKEVN